MNMLLLRAFYVLPCHLPCFPSCPATAALDGCPGFYMSTDGTVLSAQEYAASQQPKSAQARLKQQQRPPQALQQQPPPQQARRPSQEPAQERPKPKQQTPSRPTGRSPSPADSGAAKAKKPTEDGEKPNLS